MFFFNKPGSEFDPPSLLGDFLSSPVGLILRILYHLLLYLRGAPATPGPPIRVVCISDTHTKTQQIPQGDILIHAGDLTNAGTVQELQAQLDWLNSLPHPHKFAIAGNHDTYLDPRSRTTLAESDRVGALDWGNICYLQHSTATVDFPSHDKRTLNIYGAPQIPACGPSSFAFQYDRGCDSWSDTIPVDTDILITHTPPKFHLDLPGALGCEWLLRESYRVKPRLHVFGHVHAGRGKEVVWWDETQIAYERARGRHKGPLRDSLNLFLWIDLARVLLYGISGVLWNRIWGGEARGGVLVNSSLMYNNTGKLGHPAQVVEI